MRVQWSPDGRFLARSPENVINAVTGDAHVLPLGNTAKSPGSGYGSLEVAFTTDSQLLADATSGSTVRVVDIATGQVRNTFSIPNWASCVAISQDNKLLAAGSGLDVQHTSGAVKIWNLSSGTSRVALEAFYLSVWDVAFSPDGTRLAAAIGDYKSNTNSLVPGEVVVWDVQSGVALHRFRGHRSCVWAVAFSPDGKRLASVSGHKDNGGVPGEVKLWDLTTGQEVCSFPGHTGTVYGVAFSPCGRRLATGSVDGTVKIWDGTPLAETPSRSGLPEVK